MKYERLDWDTEFLGVTVVRITEPFLHEQELSKILSELKVKNVSLAYWASSQELEGITAKRFGGVLVDKKTSFAMDFRCKNADEFVCSDIVEVYVHSMPISDIEDLAIQSGEYSRFAVDKRFPREKFLDLYKIWINRSLCKEIAEEVFVIREGERVVGIVTLGNNTGRGDIGLIAVDRNYRGKGYGEKLVRAAQRWFMEHGYKIGQVVTQGINSPACNLYEKCGYSIEDVKYFYHFWI